MLALVVRNLVLHGHNWVKLEKVVKGLMGLTNARSLESDVADLLRMSEVEGLAESVIVQHDQLDFLINNAGVFATPDPITNNGPAFPMNGSPLRRVLEKACKDHALCHQKDRHNECWDVVASPFAGAVHSPSPPYL